MSVQRFRADGPASHPNIASTVVVFSLVSGYQMRPSASNLAIVSLEYRQPIVGDL
jgi:hypothetical protein